MTMGEVSAPSITSDWISARFPMSANGSLAASLDSHRSSQKLAVLKPAPIGNRKRECLVAATRSAYRDDAKGASACYVR